MLWLILFVFGLAIGSFLNVVALRYDGGLTAPLFSPRAIGGRSHCPQCGRTLRWFELVPLASYIIQGGACRNCGAKIGLQYPVAELISGLIFVFVPLRIMAASGAGGALFIGLAAFWVIAFEMLFLMSLIDIRLGIIPDGLNISVFVLALFFNIFVGGSLGAANHSLLGAYASVFGLQSNLWVNHIAAALLAGAFFGLLIAITRGRGMGFGDLKLAVPLGFLMGWPDILIAAAFAFVIGAIAGLIAIASRRRTMKGSLPFGPFFALGAAVVFFFGYQILQWYLRI
jgi:leader peptidase (prepilin peptidase)/N-methyltransferase